jgi:prolipoprotein diacylglyceryltransferase
VYVASAVAAIFAGRGGWIVQHPDEFDGVRSIFTLQAGTLAPFFAIAVGLFVSAAMVNRRKIPVVAWLDVLTPAFAVGVCLERIGALLAGVGAGTYAPDLGWAIRYPQGSPVFADHAQRLQSLMGPDATQSLPVHPAPIYGIVLGLVGLALVLRERKHRRFSGQVFFRYAVYFVLARAFVEEWFRVDAASAVVGPLNPGQVGSVVVVGLLIVVQRIRARAEPPLQAWKGGAWSAKPPKSKGKSTGRSAKSRRGASK